MSESKVKRGANRRRFFFVVTELNATTTATISIFLTLVGHAWSQPVQGSLEVRWDEGAANCGATSHEPLQVHIRAANVYPAPESVREFRRKFPLPAPRVG